MTSVVDEEMLRHCILSSREKVNLLFGCLLALVINNMSSLECVLQETT